MHVQILLVNGMIPSYEDTCWILPDGKKSENFNTDWWPLGKQLKNLPQPTQNRTSSAMPSSSLLQTIRIL
jgi:hypothetical protein